METQSQSGLTSAKPATLGHSLSSSLSSLSSLPSTPSAISPMVCSVDVASSSKNTNAMNLQPSSCQLSTRSIKLTSSVSSPQAVTGMKPVTGNLSATVERPTPDRIQSATKEELQEMLKIALDENLKLEAAACEARMSAAHHKLHYNLLSIESQEALNRMEVENYMFRREAAIMRQNPIDPAQIEYKKMLRDHCIYLKDDNVALQLALKKAKRIIKLQGWKLASAQQVINLLQERIRQNRRHINDMRRPGGPLFNISTFAACAETPLERVATPQYNHTPNANRTLRKTQDVTRENREKLDALLLAGSILNQENNKNSSPALRCSQMSTTSQHSTRNSHGTCYTSTPGGPYRTNFLLPPVQLSSKADKELQNRLLNITESFLPRCKSRDSTISASDVEELAQSWTKDSKAVEGELSPDVPEASRPKNKYKSFIQREKASSNFEESYHTGSNAAVAKRKRDDDVSWREIESKKGRNE